MTRNSEQEFARLCEGIYEDREKIWKHNPIGAMDETLLWMLLSVLNSYLSLSDIETPCFTGLPTVETYHQAILFVINDRKIDNFDAETYLEKLVKAG